MESGSLKPCLHPSVAHGPLSPQALQAAHPTVGLSGGRRWTALPGSTRGPTREQGEALHRPQSLCSPGRCRPLSWDMWGLGCSGSGHVQVDLSPQPSPSPRLVPRPPGPPRRASSMGLLRGSDPEQPVPFSPRLLPLEVGETAAVARRRAGRGYPSEALWATCLHHSHSASLLLSRALVVKSCT